MTVKDIGCGIGGPAFEMAQTFNAEVVGIDLEAPLIERAVNAAERKSLSDRCTFETVEAGPLTFADESFEGVQKISASGKLSNFCSAGMSIAVENLL